MGAVATLGNVHAAFRAGLVPSISTIRAVASAEKPSPLPRTRFLPEEAALWAAGVPEAAGNRHGVRPLPPMNWFVGLP